MSESRPAIPPFAGILLGILSVSAASIFIRYAQQDAPSLVVAAWRLSLATAVLAPIAFLRHREDLRAFTRTQLGLALLSGLFLGIHFATWITSLGYTTVASSVVLVSTSPLIVALLSPFLLGERLTRALLVSLAVTLAGVLLVGLSDTCGLEAGRLVCPALSEFVRGKAFVGDVLAFAGAVAGAGYFIIGRRLRERLSLISYVTVVYGTAAAFLVSAMFLSGASPIGYKPVTYFWFLLLALIPQLLGHSSFNWALKYLPATFVTLTTLGEPIGTTILAVLVLRETPAPLKLAGGILILAGIGLASRRSA